MLPSGSGEGDEVNYIDEIDAIAAQAMAAQPVRFEVDKRNNSYVHRPELAAAFGALATSVRGERREGVILAAQAAGLVLK